MIEVVAAIVLLQRRESVMTEPSASTASTPATSPRIVPNRSTCVPPALVDTKPPIVALPRAPSVSGKRRPDRQRGIVEGRRGSTPASTTANPASASIERMRFSRRSDRISALPSAGGVAPPTIELLPPCGTSGTRVLAPLLPRSRRLRRVRGSEYRRRRALPPLAPILQPRGDRRGVGNDALRPEHRGKLRQHRGLSGGWLGSGGINHLA